MDIKMKRGEVWTVSGGKDYAGKPRPAVIIQTNDFTSTDSITICAFTTDDTHAPLIRLTVEANSQNGLKSNSQLMVDKITTVPKSKIGSRLGNLNDQEMVKLNRAIFVFLGLTISPRVK
jgi:mRNA interferase MazF